MARAMLLGNAQDAGVPQAGCDCANCRAAWVKPRHRRQVAALGLLDAAAGLCFLVDATPDFREQQHALLEAAPGARLGGVLLTHAHMGHYTGLVHLGFEAMAARDVPLYATPSMLDFLRGHAPWRQLVEQGNVAPRQLAPETWVALTAGLSVQALPVPHRAEWSDTVGFKVRGARRELLYLPDIDSWQAWAGPPWRRDVRAVVAGVDVALLDGSFYSSDELPGRDLAAIGHPLVTETAARLAGVSTDVYVIHLNHSNPLHHPGPERDRLRAQGVGVGEAGQAWEL